MKRLFFSMVIMAFCTMSFAQTTLFSAKVKKEEVPVVITESVVEDFPDFEVIDYYGIPFEMVEDVWYVDTDKEEDDKDYDTYLVTVKNKHGFTDVTYDKHGSVLSTKGKYTNIPLPQVIQAAIGEHFPAWGIKGDHVVMTSHRGKAKKVHYKVNLQKGNKAFNAVFDANGNLLKGKAHSLAHKMSSRKKRQK